MTRAERLSKTAGIPLALAQIVVMVANKHDVGVRSLRSESRLPHLVRIRWEIAAMARVYRDPRTPTMARFSLPEIGRALNRDHSTILYGIRKYWQS